jgi:hypothetical protein
VPGPHHQAILSLLKLNPHLVFELARRFDGQFDIPSGEYEAASNELPDPAVSTTVLHADWVIAEVATRGPKRVPTAGVAVEVEVKFNPLKVYSWLSYAAGVRRLFECRGWTLVFAPDERVRTNAQNMFATEPRASPWFVVPEMLPPIIDVDQSMIDIDRSVLTTLFHAGSNMGVACARATLEALLRVAHPQRTMYRSLVNAALRKDQRELLPRELLAEQGLDWDESEELGPMEITGAYYVRGLGEGRVEGRAEGRTEGRVEGRTEALVKAIEGACELLGIPLGPSERTQLQNLDVDGLDALHAQLVKTRQWPTHFTPDQ